MFESYFKTYSIGIVSANKELGDLEILTVPMEYLPLIDGDISVAERELSATGVDQYGVTYSINMELSNSIVAKWLRRDSNRITPPDVRVGERVIIYRFADSNEHFYWEAWGDVDLRRLETALYMWNANPDGLSDDEVNTPDNCYWLEVSAHKKMITVKTSQKNGERCIYTIQLNGGDGALTVKDNVGQVIQINSAEEQIIVINKHKTQVFLNKQKLLLDAPEFIGLASPHVKLTTDLLEWETKQLVGNVENAIELKASALTATIPTSAFTGTVTVGGLAMGSISQGASGEAKLRNITVEGQAVFEDALSARQVTSELPIIAPNV